MKGEEQSAESRRSYLGQALSTLTSYRKVSILRESLYEHKLSLGPKILNTQKRATPHLLVFITKASVKEGQQVPCF